MNNCCFHLAIPLHNLDLAKQFYVDGLGFTLGRASKQALILNFVGHQVVGHLIDKKLARPAGVYPHHFGLIFFAKKDWDILIERAKTKQLSFYREPSVRFPGLFIEHHSFYLLDPTNNLLEFKHYTNQDAILGTSELAMIGDSTS